MSTLSFLANLVARSVTPPSPSTSPCEMMERGDDTARSTLWGPSAACTSILCTVFVMTPPNEHTSEGGRDDRGVPYHAEPVPCGTDPIRCSSARGVHRITMRNRPYPVLKCSRGRVLDGGKRAGNEERKRDAVREETLVQPKRQSTRASQLPGSHGRLFLSTSLLHQHASPCRSTTVQSSRSLGYFV